MNLTHYNRCLLWLPLLFLVAGCVGFDSDQPLSDPQQAVPDPKLIGVWTSKDAPENQWQISLAGNGFPRGMHRAVLLGSAKQDAGIFFVSKVDDDAYINLVVFKDSAKIPEKWDSSLVQHYSLLGYRVNKDQWQLIPLEEKFLKIAIKNGTLKGTFEPEDVPGIDFGFEHEKPKVRTLDDTPARLTATTSQLRAFFEKNRKQIRSKEFETLTKKGNGLERKND
jgi:hypothetical protein